MLHTLVNFIKSFTRENHEHFSRAEGGDSSGKSKRTKDPGLSVAKLCFVAKAKRQQPGKRLGACLRKVSACSVTMRTIIIFIFAMLVFLDGNTNYEIDSLLKQSSTISLKFQIIL
ncbi:hypothetical protein AEA09_10460 [Lysinibacillus contaminans]|uniref:Transposase n=1 Tax=Lysinibacillus contaminans TaxID=1293441 RepID=A0ABR5K2M2_9BACI|nr:hypothetical protein AEA09_10460 [Lysinibacillus contaminans]